MNIKDNDSGFYVRLNAQLSTKATVFDILQHWSRMDRSVIFSLFVE